MLLVQLQFNVWLVDQVEISDHFYMAQAYKLF